MRRRLCNRLFIIYSLIVISAFYYLVGFSKLNSDNAVSFAHPLENLCKYPILHANDPNLKPYIRHGQRLDCFPSQPQFVSLNDDSVLTVDQSLAKRKLGGLIDCYYRPIAGGVQPNIRTVTPLGEWVKIGPDSEGDTALDERVYSAKIHDDVVEVRCYMVGQSDVEALLKLPVKTANATDLVFYYAFAQIGRPANATPVEDPTRIRPPKYGVDILVVDSTSLNMFRRHAPSSWRYMKKRMGFFHLDGYMKVADNSLVNLVPLLTGLQYMNSGDGVESDFSVNEPLDSDKVPLLWNLFRAAGCATMFNDDIASYFRGFWNYPTKVTPGFRTKPTDHFFRPWNLYHRGNPIVNSSRFCFGSRPYFQDVVRLTEQMIRRYHDKCHFSFNFLTDLTHDDTNSLELLDEYLKSTLTRLYEGGHLKNSILVVMGDHGNRVNLIRYRYIGRIEERMPFFAVYLPPSFQERYPERVRNLRLNQHRLTTHFDSFQMFHDILLGRFDKSGDKSARTQGPKDEWSRRRKGVSLFEPIPISRTCRQAHVPENHCTCLLKERTIWPASKKEDSQLLQWASDVITNWTNKRCVDSGPYSVRVLDIAVLTTNQLVQQGVRHMIDDNVTMSNAKQRKVLGEIEYFDVTYDVRAKKSLERRPSKAMLRLQHNRKLRSVLVNVEPRVLSNPTTCDEEYLKLGCVCMFRCVLYCM